VTPNEEYILELLQDAGMVTGSQVAAARDQAASAGTSVVAALTGSGVLTEEDVTRTVAAASNMEFVDLNQMIVKPEITALIPRDKAYRYGVVPIAVNDEVLMVAISDPLNFDTLDNLRFLLKREIEMVCATPEQIRQAMVKYYGSAEEAGNMLMEGMGGDEIVGSRRRTAGRRRTGRFGHYQAGVDALARSLQGALQRHSS
jgi:type IV pilus assembly protein PilB